MVSGSWGGRCTEGERREAVRWWWWGDSGAMLGGQWRCSQACQCASCSPLPLWFLSLPCSRSVFGLAHRGCCGGALWAGNEPFSPQTNTGRRGGECKVVVNIQLMLPLMLFNTKVKFQPQNRENVISSLTLNSSTKWTGTNN